jgi:hypothetical protein
MSRGEADLRKSLGYTDVSDNAQTCSRCTYFKSAAGAACGTCDILSGGAVTAGGHCRSWTERGA